MGIDGLAIMSAIRCDNLSIVWEAQCAELFLKHGKGSVANDVTDEMVRLNWLTAFMPLPTIKHFIRTPDDAWLLTTAIPGENSIPGIRRIS